MVTLRQHVIHKCKRTRKYHWTRSRALRHNPQKRGVVNRIYTESPKKPNSAKRRVARVRLCTGKNLRVKVPGEGFGTLQRYSAVLVRGAHPRDLPGIRYAIIRGKLGSNPWIAKRKGRSKYGVKRIHATKEFLLLMLRRSDRGKYSINKSLFIKFKKPSRSRYIKLFFRSRKGDIQRVIYSNFQKKFYLFDKRAFLLSQVLTRHGKTFRIHKKLSSIFRNFYWRSRTLSNRTWLIELRQSHQKAEFIIKIIKGIFDREEKTYIEEQKNIKKIRRIKQSINKLWTKNKKQTAIKFNSIKNKFIVANLVRKSLKKFKPAKWIEWIFSDPVNQAFPFTMNNLAFVISRWYYTDMLGIKNTSALRNKIFNLRIRSKKWKIKKKIFFFFKMTKTLKLFKKKKIKQKQTASIVRKLFNIRNQSRLMTAYLTLRYQKQLWIKIYRSIKKKYKFKSSKKNKNIFESKEAEINKTPEKTQNTQENTEESTLVNPDIILIHTKSWKRVLRQRRVKAFTKYTPNTAFNIWKKNKIIRDTRRITSTISSASMLMSSKRSINVSSQAAFFNNLFNNKKIQLNKNYAPHINYIKQSKTLSRLNYNIMECRMADLNANFEVDFLFLNKNYKKISYKQFYDELFYILRPIIRLSPLTVGHKSARRITKKAHFSATRSSREKEVFIIFHNEINKNEKYNLLKRNTIRKANKKKKSTIGRNLRKSERLIEPFNKRLGIELFDLLFVEGSMRKKLDDYDREITQFQNPNLKHFRWRILLAEETMKEIFFKLFKMPQIVSWSVIALVPVMLTLPYLIASNHGTDDAKNPFPK